MSRHKFDDYLLKIWRRFCRLRDGRRCRLCNLEPVDGRGLEVHHVYPKSLYPEIAYSLDNGVTLCFSCHRVTVHARNSFDLSNWQKFIPIFNQWFQSQPIADFNRINQSRVARKRRRKTPKDGA